MRSRTPIRSSTPAPRAASRAVGADGARVKAGPEVAAARCGREGVAGSPAGAAVEALVAVPPEYAAAPAATVDPVVTTTTTDAVTAERAVQAVRPGGTGDP